VRTAALVPFADMLNHYRPRETKWTFDNGRQVWIYYIIYIHIYVLLPPHAVILAGLQVAPLGARLPDLILAFCATGFHDHDAARDPGGSTGV
jgi:hypothetical protein